jgi:hypothetical protein
MSNDAIPGRGRHLHAALEALQAPPLQDAEETRKVQVVGRVVDGRIELDQTSLTEFTKNFPDANITFLAVNAPFDPVRAPAAAPA